MNNPGHALHNEQACELLFSASGEQFNDWVVTTAFYSALHFALYDLFPMDHDGIHYATFSGYHLDLPKKISKHAALLQLVAIRSPYARQYRWLYGNCMCARYIDYKVPHSKAVHAKRLLGIIKSSLSKPLI
jgi:hypothetical protein